MRLCVYTHAFYVVYRSEHLTVLWITGLTALWITRAVLAVDYVASPLWISQPFGLGRICPHLTALWITRAVLAVDYVASPLWITGLTALWISGLEAWVGVRGVPVVCRPSCAIGAPSPLKASTASALATVAQPLCPACFASSDALTGAHGRRSRAGECVSSARHAAKQLWISHLTVLWMSGLEQ